MSTFEGLKTDGEAAWRNYMGDTKPLLQVGMGSCGVAAGAEEALAVLRREVTARNIPATVSITGCNGMCFAEPLVMVTREGRTVTYGEMTPERIPALVEEVLVRGGVWAEAALGVSGEEEWQGIRPLAETEFFRLQERRLMARCGVIDPENIEHNIALGGYAALHKALSGMTPETVIQEMNQSGLAGRGGANFPCGRKWDFLRQAKATPKYMICNADEGDPGAFVNRILLESDPHLVIEGILIGAYATGAEAAYIYLREEYPLAARRLRIALEQARARGLVGDNILGLGFKCNLELVVGAGSYVCGEETGLISSIQDSRGMPRIRPPFPAQAGVFGKPTNVNNVETYANAPLIIAHGGQWYASMGTERARGTKMFSISGHIVRTGVVEVPLGTPLRRIFEEAGGGVGNGRPLKAIQSGGPLSGFLTARHLDLPLEPQAFAPEGVLMGSGGLVFVDEGACLVDMVLRYLTFAQDESCARCTTCRIGTQRYVDILERITQGKGRPQDLDTFRWLEGVMRNGNCAHGQASPTAVISTLRHFPEEYEAHIREKCCPAGVCPLPAASPALTR
ncbi:MAG: SLBB domain-containing protein [Chloroflexi bacterium]|nr:SLBB domain-containing protein [Chloroflexota bacterium]